MARTHRYYFLAGHNDDDRIIRIMYGGCGGAQYGKLAIRIMAYLLESRRGEKDGGPQTAINADQLGQALGATRQAVGRALSELREDRVVDSTGSCWRYRA